MSSVARPRRRLPRRVYWTRRALVLGVLALLLFGVTRLFGGSGPDPRPTAAPVASPSSGLTPSATRPAAPVAATAAPQTATRAGTRPGRTRRKHRHAASPSPTPTPLAVPTGPCANGDVQVTPAIKRAYAGRDVTITLELTTRTSPACTWEVSPKTVVVQLTSGSDQIWSSQDCPSAVGQHSVVVRRDQPTKVRLVWGGRRSDPGCSRSTLWAQPGWYHVEAAAYGAGPADEQFHLLRPPRPTVTRTPKPRKKPGGHSSATGPAPASGSTGNAGSGPAASPTSTPTH